MYINIYINSKNERFVAIKTSLIFINKKFKLKPQILQNYLVNLGWCICGIQMI